MDVHPDHLVAAGASVGQAADRWDAGRDLDRGLRASCRESDRDCRSASGARVAADVGPAPAHLGARLAAACQVAVDAIAQAAHRRDERRVAGRAPRLGAKVVAVRDALGRPEQSARQVRPAAAPLVQEQQQASGVLQREPQEQMVAVSPQVAESEERQVLRQPEVQEPQEPQEQLAQSLAQQAWPLRVDARPVVAALESEPAPARRACAARPWQLLLSRLVRLRRRLPRRRPPVDGASPFRRHRQG